MITGYGHSFSIAYFGIVSYTQEKGLNPKYIAALLSTCAVVIFFIVRCICTHGGQSNRDVFAYVCAQRSTHWVEPTLMFCRLLFCRSRAHILLLFEIHYHKLYCRMYVHMLAVALCNDGKLRERWQRFRENEIGRAAVNILILYFNYHGTVSTIYGE